MVKGQAGEFTGTHWLSTFSLDNIPVSVTNTVPGEQELTALRNDLIPLYHLTNNHNLKAPPLVPLEWPSSSQGAS